MRMFSILLVVGVAGILSAAALEASGLLDRDKLRLERAKETHSTEVSRAAEQYLSRVQRANTALERVYDPVIRQYASRGGEATAEELRQELAELMAAAVVVPQPGDSSEITSEECGHEQLIASVGSDLVRRDQTSLPADLLGRCEYVLLYFSAEWCGPCRRFTPELVRFYEQHRSGDNFEVLLISLDRSEPAMYQYMNNFNMPWLAVPFPRVNPSGLNQRYAGRGIPNLLVVDQQGEVVLSSYVDGRYVGPSRVLSDFQQLLK